MTWSWTCGWSATRARDAQRAMEKLVLGETPKGMIVSVQCWIDKVWCTQDPDNPSRFICPTCAGVVNVTIARNPKAKGSTGGGA